MWRYVAHPAVAGHGALRRSSQQAKKQNKKKKRKETARSPEPRRRYEMQRPAENTQAASGPQSSTKGYQRPDTAHSSKRAHKNQPRQPTTRSEQMPRKGRPAGVFWHLCLVFGLFLFVAAAGCFCFDVCLVRVTLCDRHIAGPLRIYLGWFLRSMMVTRMVHRTDILNDPKMEAKAVLLLHATQRSRKSRYKPCKRIIRTKRQERNN